MPRPTSKKCPAPCRLHPLFADFGVVLGVFGGIGAGTAWSSVIAIRSGCSTLGAPIFSKICGGRSVVMTEVNIGLHVQNIADAGAAHTCCAGKGFFGKGVSGHCLNGVLYLRGCFGNGFPCIRQNNIFTVDPCLNQCIYSRFIIQIAFNHNFLTDNPHRRNFTSMSCTFRTILNIYDCEQTCVIVLRQIAGTV